MPKTNFILYNPNYHEAVREISILADDVSDGHHTMSELYQHRHALFIALCKVYDNYITPLQSRVKCWKSKLHDDGTMFDGWFILGMTVFEFTGPTTTITYHLPMTHWNRINVMEIPNAPPWDGHTSDDVLLRLYKL